MLFIYSALSLGGVETFFVRMAKERSSKGLYTAILLLSKSQRSNNELLTEIKKYADVYFVEDFFINFIFFARNFPLLMPLKTQKIKVLLDKVSQIHVYGGMHALLAYRISKLCDKKTPITVGFYHYITYVWGGDNVAYYEKLNRQFVFEHLPRKSLLFFSSGNRDFHVKQKKLNFEQSNVFRLGVVDSKKIDVNSKVNSPLRICSVGRLVAFKSYNIYMLDVVRKLLDNGVEVVFDVYGDGPLKSLMTEELEKLNLSEHVFLKGTLDYSKFDDTVSSYDLFIGSGTAVIQAASLGVPSIAAVENISKPETYGFFSDIHQYEYNLKGLGIPLFEVYDLIKKYIENTPENKFNLKEQHLKSILEFTNESCQDSMDALKDIEMPKNSFKFNRWLYEISRLLDWLNRKLNKNHAFNTRFIDFKF